MQAIIRPFIIPSKHRDFHGWEVAHALTGEVLHKLTYGDCRGLGAGNSALELCAVYARGLEARGWRITKSRTAVTR